jgi:hypothetical protein
MMTWADKSGDTTRGTGGRANDVTQIGMSFNQVIKEDNPTDGRFGVRVGQRKFSKKALHSCPSFNGMAQTPLKLLVTRLLTGASPNLDLNHFLKSVIGCYDTHRQFAARR